MTDSAVLFVTVPNIWGLLSLYATADMGIHLDGWTLRDAVDFFGGYQITDKQVIKEIYQLIVEEPAHYLKYYIGLIPLP